MFICLFICFSISIIVIIIIIIIISSSSSSEIVIIIIIIIIIIFIILLLCETFWDQFYNRIEIFVLVGPIEQIVTFY